MQIVAALLALIAAVQPDATPLRGTLCFVAPKLKPVCQTTEGSLIKIASAEQERTLIWSTADGKRATIGLAPAKSEAVDLENDSFRDLRLDVRGDKNHGWPADLQVKITDAKRREWTWTIAAKQAEALSTIRLPVGRYTFAFSAEHHLTDTRRMEIVKNASLGAVALRPMPAVFGRVVSSKNEPLPDAQIARTDRPTVIATTDEQGNFRGEVGDPAPDSVLVEKAGLGTLLLPMQRLGGDIDLGVVRLGSPLKLTLRIVRPESVRDSVKVTLLRISGFKYELVRIGSKELSAGDETVAFEDLSSGKYAILLEGKNPLERQSDSVDLKDASAEKEIKIEPYHLDGTAKLGEDPINGALNIQIAQAPMSLQITDGRFGGTLWQRGRLFAWFTANDNALTQVVNSPELGAEPSVWEIRFPKRFITGRVYDADSQQPVQADVRMLITSGTDQDANRLYTTVKTEADGSFSILSTKPGTYEMTVNLPDYVAHIETVVVRDEDGSIQRDIPLNRGVTTVIEAVWPSGAPVANTQVFEGVASDGHNPERIYALDGNGRLTLHLLRGESHTLYILPSDGSFGIAHVVAPESEDAKPLRVVVPLPAGSFRIHIKDGDGKPVGARIGMRFNGEVLPFPVISRLPTPAGRTESFDLLQLPAGSYELWPASYESVPLGTPRSVGLSLGMVEVEFTVSRK